MDALATFAERVNKPKPSDEGDGWLLEYVCTLLKNFFNGRQEYVWDELPMCEGWAYFQWAVNNDALTRLCGGRIGVGYLSQEVRRLVDQAEAADPRWRSDGR